MKNIRLKQQNVDIIIAAFREAFGLDAHLWLFGSRVNPQAKGGDIDLYIETITSDVKIVFAQKIAFVNQLYRQLGEQKIDVVINMLGNQQSLPIYEIAKTEGVQLI